MVKTMSTDLEKGIKDLTKLSNILENFYYYHLRRNLGNFYILISATVSVFLFLGFYLEDYLTPIIGETYSGLSIGISMIIGLIVLFFVTFNYFKFIKIYKPEEKREKSIMWLWVPLSVIFMTYMFIGPIFNPPIYTYPLAIELFVALGNLVNYLDSKSTEHYPGKVEREYLYYVIILLIGVIAIPFYPGYGWFIVTITALVGAYVIGIYITLTAEKVFIEAGVYGEHNG